MELHHTIFFFFFFFNENDYLIILEFGEDTRNNHKYREYYRYFP